MGQKKKLAEAEQQQSPTDTAHKPSFKKPRLGPPLTLGSQRSIYFCQSPKDHSARLGSEFFDQPAVSLARALLGQVMYMQQYGLWLKCQCRPCRHHVTSHLTINDLALCKWLFCPHWSLDSSSQRLGSLERMTLLVLLFPMEAGQPLSASCSEQ